MKLRIIRSGQLFVPQQNKKTYYNSSWVGFGYPNIKFIDEEDALAFVKLVDKSATPRSKEAKVVYTNYEYKKEAPKKKSKNNSDKPPYESQ